MKETTENTVHNKFRQMADDDCKDIGKSITKVQLHTPNKVYGLTKKFVNFSLLEMLTKFYWFSWKWDENFEKILW